MCQSFTILQRFCMWNGWRFFFFFFFCSANPLAYNSLCKFIVTKFVLYNIAWLLIYKINEQFSYCEKAHVLFHLLQSNWRARTHPAFNWHWSRILHGSRCPVENQSSCAEEHTNTKPGRCNAGHSRCSHEVESQTKRRIQHESNSCKGSSWGWIRFTGRWSPQRQYQ